MERESTETSKYTFEDDWVKASEARYDSMKHLLQSVRHDIDALTSRIDQTQCSTELLRLDGTSSSVRQQVSSTNSSALGVPTNGGQAPLNCRPDILANVISGAEEAFKDEYMDIQIRESRTSFTPQYNDDQLLECKVAGPSSDQIEDKSWRSPSDFNVHDPFESVRLPNEFTGGATHCGPMQHCNHPTKETDLDDLDLHQFEPDDDSAGSLSPAVSPTFENYVTEGVSLNNMLVTKDESGHFQFDPNDSSMKPSIPEEYRVYDNGHALTTIDEASEEIEDDWSSSDMDLSTHSHQPSNQTNLVTSSNVILEVCPERSIEPGFKTSAESTPGPLNVFTGDDNHMMYTTEYRIKSTSLKSTSDAERTFVGEASNIDGSDPHKAYDHVVVLRPKRAGVGESPVKQRPISAGSLRGYMRNGDGSVTGSLHSVVSMLSQESVLSEADSYVTVASRFNTTGSDDMYTTACSDFESHDQHTPNIYAHQDNDECPTLSRKRTKLSKSQRHRPMDFQPQSASSSDDDENEDVLRITEAIVVTPKFSRLPSKMASPKEDGSSTFWGGADRGTEAKIQPVENISKVTGTPGVISYKRIALRRPKRSSPVHKNFPTDESPNRSDPDAKSSDSSSSADEADYDASASITWASRQIGSESGVLLPDSVHEPVISFDQVPCSIQKSSVVASSPLERCKRDRDQDRNIDGDHMVVGSPGNLQDSRTISSRFVDRGSSDASGIMVVPKYNLSSQHPVNNTQVQSVAFSAEDRQQCAESQTDLARASTRADDSRLAKPNEPVVTQRVDSDFAASQHKQRDPTEIDETKTNVSSFLVSHDPVAATQCPEKACAASTVLSTSGEEINESNESKQDQRAGNQVDGTEEDMHGARINYNTNPSYLNKQQFGTSHIYNDHTREIAKQNATNFQRLDSSRTMIDSGSRAVLPLGAVLSSAEASAARPSIYSPPPSTVDDLVNKQRAKDTSDVLIQGHQPRSELSSSTVQQRSTVTGYSSSPSSKLLNGSNDTGGARHADASQAARLFSPSSCLGTKADNEPGESQPYREIPIQSSYVRKIALSVDVPTYQPEDRLRAGNPGTGEQSTYPVTRLDTGSLHTRHRTNVITVENASSVRPVPSEQSFIPSFSDDIQAASQRTSRILHGKAELFDAPTTPFADTHVPLSVRRDSSHTDLEETHADSLAGRISGIELSDPSRANSHHAGEEPHVRDQTVFSPLSKTADLKPIHSQVELMRSPKVVSPVQLESESLANCSQQCIQSLSPPYSVTRPTGFRSSPPLIRPKWQLKPIPTDSEIRERLRSRSRQRADTRQSRPVHPELTGSYRPRSSRSDSRYRCTDLDSAIAESKAETSPYKTQNVEVFSDAKQSASLFDLGEQLRKSTKTSYFHQNGSTARSSGIEDATTRQFFGDAKSYSSLLETDIDTGENFERPIILETDVDNLDTLINGRSFTAPIEDYCQPKTRSLFNLTHSYTPGLHRRQTTMDKSPGVIETNAHLSNDLGDNWQRTKSLQGLTHRDRESPTSRQDISHQNKAGSIGAKGLIERLRERARSTHELRIAQSLTKLRIPEWLDKAECLSRSVVEGAGSKDRDRPRQKELTSELTRTLSSKEDDQSHSRSNLSTLRSLSNIRKVEGPFSPKWLPKSTTVETVAEPTRPRAGISHQPRFIRPSQELRERGESVSRLRPIRSKLYSSMKSLAGAQSSLEKTATDLRPQVAPRPHKTMIVGQGTEMKLSPQDFVPKEEQVWGHQHRQVLASANPPASGTPNTQPASNHFDTVNLVSPRISSNLLDTGRACLKESERIQEDIKPADYDSGTEHSGDLTESSVRKHPASMIKQVEPVHALNGTQAQHIQSNRMEVHDRRLRKGPADRFVCSNFDSDSGPEVQSPRDEFSGEHPCSDWHSIDAEGDPESEATDGLDQISDLTCLTSLVDTCASRHQALLANRPSALEHLLTSLGWWPPVPQTEHRYLPPTAAEAISIAAHEFDVDDDSHRTEFIQLLTSPESRRPINLGEFALNQLSGAVQRKQEDGLLYISCGRSECTKSPIQVNQAVDWCACPNCYTLYCSSVCRAIDRRAAHDHPTICSFARAKRVCNRLLRNLAAGQVTGLTALAKTGMARLGRGGILLPFALVQHAELFLQRARSYTFLAQENVDNSLEYASSCWENKHLPSPGGLMSPPLYLTLKELEELDSTVAKPCQSYNPSSSMVLIVVVCAYELIARSDGRPVHLFKQSLIIPFPVHNAPCINSGQPGSPAERPVKFPRTVLTKPVLPQTNGLLSKPDRQAAAAREAYMIRLQRVLRERGVSLRHHHPEIYTQIANYVETGVPFAPIRIVFHDFVLREEVLCTIQPMCDPLLQPTRQMQSRQRLPNDLYEEVTQEAPQQSSAITEHSPTTSQRHMARPFPETDF